MTTSIIATATATAFLLCAASVPATEQAHSRPDPAQMMAALQASHIAANGPPEARFMKLLERDARAYLAARKLPSKTVRIEMLRKGATQSGVSYPKYYVWVRATDRKGHRLEGAMRVAAIERVRFEVLDFTPADAIRSAPVSLASAYPALLIPSLQQHAAAQ